MDPKQLNEYIKLGGSILAGLVTALGLWRVFRARIGSALQTVAMAHSFKQLFGVEPAEEIRRLLRALSDAHTINDAKLNIAFMHLKVGVYICTAKDGRCIWVNEYICRMFGMSDRQMLGFGWTAAISDDEREDARERWQKSCIERLPYKDSYHITDQRGIAAKVATEAFFVEIEGGLMVGYVVPVSDNWKHV